MNMINYAAHLLKSFVLTIYFLYQPEILREQTVMFHSNPVLLVYKTNTSAVDANQRGYYKVHVSGPLNVHKSETLMAVFLSNHSEVSTIQQITEDITKCKSVAH